MSRLARTNRVIFVEPPRDPDIGYLADVRRKLPNLWRAVATDAISPNLSVIAAPPALAVARQVFPGAALALTVPAAAQVSGWVMRWHLKRVFRALHVRHPIVWAWDPRELYLAGHLDEKLLCYFVYDEIADFPVNARVRKLFQALDKRMCRRADVVLASSNALYRKRQRWNPNTYLVPNAVDFDHYAKALDPSTSIAAEVCELRRPIIGFVGWLGHQVDVALLRRLAEAYPHGSLVLVGPDALKRDETYHALRRQPNVHFLGRKPLAALPGYLKAFDAALIPYRRSGHTHAIYPLKLHEYLAAGRSVVSADLPEVRQFASVTRIASTTEGFVNCVAHAIADNDARSIGQRLAVARENTWDQRVERIHAIFDGLLAVRREKRPSLNRPLRV